MRFVCDAQSLLSQIFSPKNALLTIYSIQAKGQEFLQTPPLRRALLLLRSSSQLRKNGVSPRDLSSISCVSTLFFIVYLTVTWPGLVSCSAYLIVPSLSITMAQRPFLSPFPAIQPWLFEKNVFVSLRKSYAVLLVLGSSSFGGRTHNIITGDLVDFSPSVHYPRIVRRNHCDDIYALALQLTGFLDVWREMVGLAAGSESAFEFISILPRRSS